MERAGRRRILFVSNGHGEDWIAAAMVRALPAGFSAEAYPMIGEGNAYADVCPVVGPRALIASEGGRNVRGSFWRDIRTGALGTLGPALGFLRRVRGLYDDVVVVGDMVGVLFGLAAGHRGLVYVDVYKTGAARLYSFPERAAIRAACRTVFCRAGNLAAPLAAMGVDARCAGNVMMDTIPFGDYDAEARRTRPLAVTLLPGSRAQTVENFALQIAALRLLPDALVPDVFLAVAGGVDVPALSRAAGLERTALLSAEAADLGVLTDGRITVNMARGGAMGNLLRASDAVLSQAGTATVQAIGSGRPALTFVTERDKRSRIRDEQGLYGEARIVVEAAPEALAAALEALLSDAEDRRRRAAIGRARIGPPGALDAIVEAIAAA